jgi:acetolactate synthase-1/2/3 large subunit
MIITGARIIVNHLKRRGVRIVTGIPGGSILPLYDALADNGSVRHVLARHEQGAAFMAQGMARLTGLPGVCLATSGPGATNLVTAVADAHRDGVPLVCLTGQTPLNQLGTEAFQEVDIVSITRPITKMSRMVRRACDLDEALDEAFRLAVSGRPGPVLLDIPKDVQLEELDDACGAVPGGDIPEDGNHRSHGGFHTLQSSLPAHSGQDSRPGDSSYARCGVPLAPTGWDASRAAAMINAARRPVLLLGGGATRGRTPELARGLAEKACLPVTMTLMGLGTVPAGHPLSLGMHGMHGHPVANRALAECDLLVAVGNRFDDRATGRPETFCPKARIIHVNVDPSEFGRILRADLAVASDAALALAAFLPVTERRERPEWLDRVNRFRAEAPLAGPGEGPGCARELIGRVASKMREDAVIVTDVGQHQMFVAQSFPFHRAGRFLTSGGLGVMGFGLPAAIGAGLAWPEAQVVLFSGDGSLKMNIQELATLADTGANVKVVVLDNQCLGLVTQQQRLFFAGRKSASRYARGTDFASLAQAFGVPGVDLEACPDPDAALHEAFHTPGPFLIHARVDREGMVFPMVPPGASNAEMLHGHPEIITPRLPRAVNMG